jgi:hypothetical protein
VGAGVIIAREACYHQGTPRQRRCFIDLRVVVHLDAKLDVLGQSRPDLLGHQVDHLRRAEPAASPFRPHVPGDEPALACVERPSADTVNDFFAMSFTPSSCLALLSRDMHSRLPVLFQKRGFPMSLSRF